VYGERPTLLDWLSNREQRAVAGIELNDDSVAQRGVRNAIAQHDPPRLPPTLFPPGIRHVHSFEAVVSRAVNLSQDRQRAYGGVAAEDAVMASRGIFAVAQREKQHGAHRDPQWVEHPEAPAHARYHSRAMTRDEIQRQLIDIIPKEKDIPDEKLSLETPLADAGIDSLDALTILFAIEEQFHISIPDDKARAMRTLGDMVTVVEQLTS